MKPIIGLSPSFDLEKNAVYLRNKYSYMIEHCGGIPFILPHTDDPNTIETQLDLLDGVILTGGADVAPSLYGEEVLCKNEELQPIRDDYDMLLLTKALERRIPIFGICRGFQLINVYFGGSLYQDTEACVPGSVLHRLFGVYSASCHKMTLHPGTPLHDILQQDLIAVNSVHHQCVHELADSLIPMATSIDGIIEACYHPDYPCIWGVQWHPEFIYKDDENSCKIVRAFLRICSKNQETA